MGVAARRAAGGAPQSIRQGAMLPLQLAEMPLVQQSLPALLHPVPPHCAQSAGQQTVGTSSTS